MRNLRSTSDNSILRMRLTHETWDDLRFPAVGLNPPGAASDPAINTTTGLLEFSASLVNIIVGVAQMPHSWKFGTAIEPHIHWMPSTTNVGKVNWTFEYKVIPVHGTLPGSYTSTPVIHTTDGVANKHVVTAFPSIPMDDHAVSTMIMWKLSRVGTDAVDDTFTGLAQLLEVDFHYQLDSLGSDYEYTKIYP